VDSGDRRHDSDDLASGVVTPPPAAHSRFEAYFNDQFGLRRRLIHWLNVLKVAGLGVSPSAKVILGKHHWLFDRPN
jgi:hypothetical protein